MVRNGAKWVVSDSLALNLEELVALLNRVDSLTSFTPISLTAEKEEKVEIYLHGCLWNIKMISTGQCPDYKFYYLFSDAPSKLEIKSWISKRGTKMMEYVSPSADKLPLDPLRSLLACLPPHHSEFLPDEIQEDFVSTFPEDFYEFDTHWQPIPPRQTIEELIGLIELAQEVDFEDYGDRFLFTEALLFSKMDDDAAEGTQYWFEIGEVDGLIDLDHPQDQVRCKVYHHSSRSLKEVCRNDQEEKSEKEGKQGIKRVLDDNATGAKSAKKQRRGDE